MHQDIAGELSHVCPRCGKGFIHKSSLTHHLFLHDKSSKKKTTTSSVNQKFIKGSDGVDVTCKFCDRQFVSFRLASHIRLAHPDDYFKEKKDFIHCTQCDEKFSGKRGKILLFSSRYFHIPTIGLTQKLKLFGIQF